MQTHSIPRAEHQTEVLQDVDFEPLPTWWLDDSNFPFIFKIINFENMFHTNNKIGNIKLQKRNSHTYKQKAGYPGRLMMDT